MLSINSLFIHYLQHFVKSLYANEKEEMNDGLWIIKKQVVIPGLTRNPENGHSYVDSWLSPE